MQFTQFPKSCIPTSKRKRNIRRFQTLVDLILLVQYFLRLHARRHQTMFEFLECIHMLCQIFHFCAIKKSTRSIIISNPFIAPHHVFHIIFLAVIKVVFSIIIVVFFVHIIVLFYLAIFVRTLFGVFFFFLVFLKLV